MDSLDIKILRILQQDCSQTVAEIGKKVGLSSSPCWKRINKLIQDGVIIKQTAILVAHYMADNKPVPTHIIDYDIHFASKLFEMQQFKSVIKLARKEKDQDREMIYSQRLDDANYYADQYKAKIQDIFHSTFGAGQLNNTV